MTAYRINQFKEIDGKGAVLLSKEVRKKAGIGPGTLVFVRELGQGQVLIQEVDDGSEVFRGLVAELDRKAAIAVEELKNSEKPKPTAV